MKKLSGVTVAMVTPIDEQDKPDICGLKELTDFLIESGVDCLYPCGTTGEMLKLSTEERMEVAEAVVQAAGNRVPVFVHCGALREDDTIRLLEHARSVGADGAGVVTPIFFGTDERAMVAYYERLAKHMEGFPIYLYSIPQCAANYISTASAKAIAANCPNIIGIKYSYPDVNQTAEYLSVNEGNFSVLHGCDKAMVGFMALGCDGTVSGVAGVFPEPFVKACRAFKSGDMENAVKWQRVCAKFCNTLHNGGDLSYFKEALKLRGIRAGFVRKPQLDLQEKDVDNLKEELASLCKEYGISLIL